MISCNSFNVIYIVICAGCLEEYIRETGVGKTRSSDRVIQPGHKKIKVEEYIKLCEMALPKYFRFFGCDQMTQI